MRATDYMRSIDTSVADNGTIIAVGRLKFRISDRWEQYDLPTITPLEADALASLFPSIAKRERCQRENG